MTFGKIYSNIVPMKPGRTPIWNVIADLEPASWLEALTVASDDRLPLPLALRRRVSWGAPKSSLPLLATIRDDGAVEVSPVTERTAELAAIRKAIGTAEAGERPAIVFAAMATYCQITLQPDGRLRLAPLLSLHLGALSGGRVWVGAHGDLIRLWSDQAWSAQLASASVALRKAIGRVQPRS